MAAKIRQPNQTGADFVIQIANAKWKSSVTSESLKITSFQL